MGIVTFFGTVSVQVAVLYIMIAVGFILTRSGKMNATGAAQMTDVLLYIVTPCVIINSFGSVEFTVDSAGRLLISAVAAVASHAVSFGIAAICFMRTEKARRNLLIAASALSNCGFMGVPLASAILGDEGVFLVSVYIAVFNIVSWTVGISLFSSENLNWKRIVLNPGVIGVAIGLVIFFARLKLPGIIAQPVGYMAGLNTPLAMVVIGYYLASGSLKMRRSDVPNFCAIAVRMVAVPLVCLALFRLCGITGNLLMAVMIPASAPTAAMVMMLSAKYQGDGIEASRIVSFSHLVSIVTMPLILTLCHAVG